MRISRAVFPVCAALALFASMLPSSARALVKVRSSVNPAIYATLPFILAADKGYFRDEGIDIAITKYNTSSVAQMPLVARGDLDITNMVAGPALFNQRTQGFDIKIIASMSETHPGWHDGDWIMVRKDLWDSGAIRTLKDVKGHTVDGTTLGSPINFLMNAALAKAGLTRADVVYSSRLHTAPDMVTALRNKAVDVLPTIEPTATQMVNAGLAHRLASEQDVVPWFQDVFFVSSAKFIREHPSAVVGFLKAYLRAAQKIVANGPNWAPEYVDALTRWSGIPAKILKSVPGVPYYGQFGTIDVASLAREEVMWRSMGVITAKVDPATLVDSSAIDEARKELGIR
ncbi:MAG TPA: ABC transporter substrate-binding protein [Stellaceae bacterium]|nr:ABC transporter substrate-binding protein [Stellaceae bacterium]